MIFRSGLRAGGYTSYAAFAPMPRRFRPALGLRE